jgi:hypothetical protein
MEQYKFLREGGGWYIDLPEYLEQGGSKGDLAMVAGADTMLDIMAEGNDSVEIQLDTKAFDDADLLELVEVCEPSMGGGYYVLHTFNGKPIHHRMWLCAVTNFVFGHLPERIYVKKV